MKKSIAAIILAVLIMLVPQAALCAESAELSPNLIVDSYSVSKKEIKAGDIFKLDFKLKNTSKRINIQNVLIHISGADVFAVNNSTDTIYADEILKNNSESFSKSFYCSNSASAGVYPISISAVYEYFENGEKISATAESNITVTVVESETKHTPNLTPQLLISDFSYGGSNVEGGAEFMLKFMVKNNSDNVNAENVIIKINGGDAFVVSDGTDTISVKKINGNSGTSVEKSFKCLNNAPTGIHQITAQIGFEYFENGQKQSASSDLTISIPVVQVDKVRFESIGLADSIVFAEQEEDCSFKIINSGQTKLLNGRVKLVDETGNEVNSAYIGNIESGVMFESNYTLPITIKELGSKKLKLVFEYENENTEKKSIEQEFTVTAEKEHDPFENINKENEVTYKDDGTKSYVIIGCIAAGIVLIIAIPLTVKIVKKKKAKKGSGVFDEEI